VAFEVADGVGDHRQIFFGRGTQDFFNVEQPGFTHDCDDRCFGFEQQPDLFILIDPNASAASSAKGCQAGILNFLRFASARIRCPWDWSRPTPSM